MFSQRYILYPVVMLLIGGGLLNASPAAQPQPSLSKFQTALDRRDYAAAEMLSRRALELQPRSPEWLTNLGIALQMQGRSTWAIDLFEQALKQKHIPRTYALLAEERCKTRDIDGSRPMLARILKEDANDPLILALVAPCYLDIDEPIEAVQIYSSLLSVQSFPNDLALIQLSKAYLLSGQFFFGRLKTLPGNEIYQRAIQNARDGSATDARGAFSDAAGRSIYFKPDASFDEAVRIWRLHPDDPALVYMLSVLSSEASIRQVEVCSERFPDSPYLDQLRLEVLADQGRDQEAEAGYQELLQTHPEIPDLEYSLGMLYRKQRSWGKAAAVFQAQIERDPKDERSAARLSEALEKLARWNDLRILLTSRVKDADPPLWASLDMAEADEKLGDAPAAIVLLKGAEKIYPSNRSIHFRLSRLYKQTGDVVEARAEVRWLQGSFSGSPD